MVSIIGIKLEERQQSAQQLQKVATEFGCSIKTRIGLHEVSDGVCSTSGVVLFELINMADEFEGALMKIKGASIQRMTF